MEIAIVVVLLLLVSTSVVEIGRYLAVWQAVGTAAQKGAEYVETPVPGDEATAPYRDCSEIKWAAVTSSGLAEIGPADVEVTFEDVTGRRIHACTDHNVDPDVDVVGDGSRLVVTVSREIEAVTPAVRPLAGMHTITSRHSRTIGGERTTD